MNAQAPEETVDDLAAAPPAGRSLIDVRSPEEFATGHVPGAVNVPLDEVLADPSRHHGDGTIHVICQSGGRSMKAASAMHEAGVAAVSVTGGTTAWIDSGRAVQQ